MDATYAEAWDDGARSDTRKISRASRETETCMLIARSEVMICESEGMYVRKLGRASSRCPVCFDLPQLTLVEIRRTTNIDESYTTSLKPERKEEKKIETRCWRETSTTQTEGKRGAGWGGLQRRGGGVRVRSIPLSLSLSRSLSLSLEAT